MFVLTHHPRPSITMDGGTTFHFVEDGIQAARERALDAADGNDVSVGGATIQQYLRAGLIDEMHLVIVPILLDGGERLFDHLNGNPDSFESVQFVCSPSVAHIASPTGRRRSSDSQRGQPADLTSENGVRPTPGGRGQARTFDESSGAVILCMTWGRNAPPRS